MNPIATLAAVGFLLGANITFYLLLASYHKRALADGISKTMQLGLLILNFVFLGLNVLGAYTLLKFVGLVGLNSGTRFGAFALTIIATLALGMALVSQQSSRSPIRRERG